MSECKIIVGTKDCSIKSVERILRINSSLFNDWSILARGLNVDEIEIKTLRRDYLLLDKINYSDLLHGILEVWVGKNGNQAKLIDLIHIIEKECNAGGTGESLRLEFHLPCRESENSSLSWQHLSSAYKERVKLNLNKRFPTVNPKIIENLNGSVLTSLMTQERTFLYKDTIPTPLKYYIKRRIISRDIISDEMLNTKSPDIFLFTGVNRYELSNLVKKEITGVSSEQVKSLNVRHILLERPEHFQKICAIAIHPVHLLERLEGKWRWLHSTRNIYLITPFVDISQERLEENEFVEKVIHSRYPCPVCIADTPGMGKSILLAEIARKLREIYPERAVLFLVISEFMDQIRQSNLRVEEVLGIIASENDLGKEVLREEFSKCDGISIELLFDGFDEVHSRDLDLAFKVLKTLNSLKSVRLWVTSRPHLLSKLEEALNTLGYKIDPFDDSNQINFLTQFWSRERQFNWESLQTFAQNCLKVLKKNMKSGDEDIAGIPLQCLLIGEVYEDDAIGYAEYGSLPTEQVQKYSIPDLYKLLIEKKIHKYNSTYGSPKVEKVNMFGMHAKLSVELLFPEHIENLEGYLPPVKFEEILKVGVIEASSTFGSPRFLHRSFAEYFIAWFIFNLIQSGIFKGELSNFMSKSALECAAHRQSVLSPVDMDVYKFVYPVISYFFNSLLEEINKSCSFSTCESILEFENLLKLSHACLYSNSEQILSFLENLGWYKDNGGNIFNESYLLRSVENSELDFVTVAFKHFNKYCKITSTLQKQAFSAAVGRGHFSIVEFLLKEKGLRKMLEMGRMNRLLVHECVRYTKDKSESEITERIEIVKLLVGLNPASVDEIHYGWTPLLAHKVHLRILNELIRLGGNVLAQDVEGEETLAHYCTARRHLGKEGFHSLLMIIPGEKLTTLFKVRNKIGDTPLSTLIREIDPLPITLELFQEFGADFNSIGAEGEPLLATALKNRRSEDTIQSLVNLGASLNWRGERGETILHVVAHNGVDYMIDYFVKEKELDVNYLDKDKLTPLDHSIRSEVSFCKYETAVKLLGNGGTFSNFIDGKFALHNAVEMGRFTSVKSLLYLGVSVNQADNEGNTALHVAVKDFTDQSDEIVQLLLDNDADPEILNNMEQSAIQRALENTSGSAWNAFNLLRSHANIQWNKSLAKQAAKAIINSWNATYADINSLMGELETWLDIHFLDEQGNSLLHHAAYKNNEIAVNFLVGKGVAIIGENNRGESPLHRAAFGGRASMMKLLIDKGADVHAKDIQNRTFLHIFSSIFWRPKDISSIYKYLVENSFTDVITTNGGDNNATPLQLLVLNQSPEEGLLEFLGQNKVNFNVNDKDGNALLFYAIKRQFLEGSLSMIRTLLKFGADWKSLNSRMETVLHMVANYSISTMLKEFIELEGLNVNGQDVDGNTPLHAAATNVDFSRFFTVLVKHGADIMIKNNAGFTILIELAADVKRRKLTKELPNLELDSMKEESERLKTFSEGPGWPVTFINAMDCAKSGFFYLHAGLKLHDGLKLHKDQVMCAFCFETVESWEKGDDPMIEHFKQFPYCPFVLGMDVGNVPLMLD